MSETHGHIVPASLHSYSQACEIHVPLPSHADRRTCCARWHCYSSSASRLTRSIARLDVTIITACNDWNASETKPGNRLGNFCDSRPQADDPFEGLSDDSQRLPCASNFTPVIFLKLPCTWTKGQCNPIGFSSARLQRRFRHVQLR